jgi:hypothetical protein
MQKWNNELRSDEAVHASLTKELFNAGTYEAHINIAKQLSDQNDKRRPSTAESNHRSSKLQKLYEKYAKKIRMQYEDDDPRSKANDTNHLGKDFFLKNIDHTKASELKVSELSYPTRLKNQQLDPRKYIGARPLSNTGYRHFFNWSRKSINLESKLREYYDIRSSFLVNEHVNLVHRILQDTFLPLIDTFWSASEETLSIGLQSQSMNNNNNNNNNNNYHDHDQDRTLYRIQNADHFDWSKNKVVRVS